MSLKEVGCSQYCVLMWCYYMCVTVLVLFCFFLLSFIFLEMDVLIIRISPGGMHNLHNTPLHSFGIWEHDMSNVEGFPVFQQTFRLPSSRLIYLGEDSHIALALGIVLKAM
jgi:hypothetical protein